MSFLAVCSSKLSALVIGLRVKLNTMGSGHGSVQTNMLTEFSDLPDNVIDIILSRLPLRDAVRTSVLSKKWKNEWTRIERLEIDSGKCLNSEGLEVADAFVSMVGNILSSHNGPIRAFYLYVPYFDRKIQIACDIDLWILSLSQRGVQDLTLEYADCGDDTWYHPFEFPLSLFQCVKLKHLSLRVAYFPPHNFRLSNLVSLRLDSNRVSTNTLTNLIVNCPLLERFWLETFVVQAQGGPFFITAPKLKLLSVLYPSTLYLILKDTPKVSTLSLSQFPGPEGAVHECQNMVDFYGAISRVENIVINCFVLEGWAQRHVPERLPIPLEKHLMLTVRFLDVDSSAQIRSMFCLIKSSPKLHSLDIHIRQTFDQPNDAILAIGYLQSHIGRSENSWSPRTVKIGGFSEKGLGVLFIQVILSCCPMLEKLYLTSGGISCRDVEFKLMSDIMRFCRASSKAEIIYSRPK